MAQDTLVESLVQDGRELLDELARDNFDVAAAWWLNPVEDGDWQFYLASPVVDKEGPVVAYSGVHKALRRLHRGDSALASISAGNIKIVGANNPMTLQVIAFRDRFLNKGAVHLRTNRLGEIETHSIYIYPRLSPQKPGTVAWEQMKLKTAIEPLVDARLSPQENQAREQIVASGISPTLADYWIQTERARNERKQPIPAGTVVEAQVVAYETDPDPLLLVKASDGTQGLTRRSNTEPLSS
jgi:hypothetical protein